MGLSGVIGGAKLRFGGELRTLYRVWTSALNGAEVDRVLAAAHARPSEGAKTFSSYRDTMGVRSATVCWMDQPWLRDLLQGYIEKANRDDFHLPLDGAAEFQLITYAASQGDHYDWHHDVDWASPSARARKLSITVQLSESDAYTGGDFELEDLKTNADFRPKGTVIVFPSVLRHRISPVSTGTRIALVGWFSGPRWR